jgi:AraC-like DNA-binding protein
MTKRAPTAIASMTWGLVRWARDQGIAIERLVPSGVLEELTEAGEDGRIRRHSHDAVWLAIERELGDPSFALRSAPALLSPSSFGAVGLLAMTSGTVGESLARSAKYSPVLKEDVHVQLSVRDARLVIELWSPDELLPSVEEASLFAFLHFLRSWTECPIEAKAVFLRQPQPAAPLVSEAFGCPVHHRQPRPAIVFDRDIHDLPMQTAREEVARYLEGVAGTELARVLERQRALGLQAEAREAVRWALLRGSADIDTVARRLGTSARTLQRSLAREGQSYRSLVDEVRWSLAAPLVASSNLSFEEIAERLGYGDAKAFRRAFRRWSGAAPVEMRRRHRGAGEGDAS